LHRFIAIFDFIKAHKFKEDLRTIFLQLKAEHCTTENCKTMNAGQKYYYYRCVSIMMLIPINFRYEFLWADGYKIKKPTKVTAPEYVNLLFQWIDSVTSEGLESAINGTIFCNFRSKLTNLLGELIYQTIFKRLFRVWAHFYHSHYNNVADPLKFNTMFKVCKIYIH
jgi:hypothetical protein